MKRKIRDLMLLTLFSLIIGFVLFVRQGMTAVAMIGTTGLANIPTAYIIPDGRLALGAAYMDAQYGKHGSKYAQVAYYATMGYLPFLEVSLRTTVFRGDTKPYPDAYGAHKDRMASVKLRIINESQHLPSVVLGVHDVYGTMYFHAQYVVISKSIHIPLLEFMNVHLGYAAELIKSKRINSMKGAFAGIEKGFGRYLKAMGEYDTQKYNIGIRMILLDDRISIDVAALGMKRISGGMNISVDL